MTAPTDLDLFWAKAQLDLLGLPRPDTALEALERVDPELHRRLSEGEQWLVRQADVERLRKGWPQWIGLYRKAVAVLQGEDA